MTNNAIKYKSDSAHILGLDILEGEELVMGLQIRANEMKVWETFTLERQLECIINADHLLLFRGNPHGSVSLSDVIASELIGI